MSINCARHGMIHEQWSFMDSPMSNTAFGTVSGWNCIDLRPPSLSTCWNNTSNEQAIRLNASGSKHIPKLHMFSHIWSYHGNKSAKDSSARHSLHSLALAVGTRNFSGAAAPIFQPLRVWSYQKASQRVRFWISVKEVLSPTYNAMGRPKCPKTWVW